VKQLRVGADAELDVKVRFAGCTTAYAAEAKVYVDDELVLTTSISVPVSLNPSDKTAVVYHSPNHVILDPQLLSVGKINVKNAELWWPRGYGEQRLYVVRVDVTPRDSGSEGKSFRGNKDTVIPTQTISRKVGIREVELIQERYPPASKLNVKASASSGSANPQPASFYFRINNEPIFMRGANLIPLDSIPARVSTYDRAYLLHAAVEANYNAIRVWGGGYYQADDLYEYADEMGILMWQEIMLAVRRLSAIPLLETLLMLLLCSLQCALYPRNIDFLRDIAIEVQEQAVRLSSYASVVTWGGNNENEVALGWFSASNLNRDLYVADYSKLYADTVFPALFSVDNDPNGGPKLERAWVDSSPSNGLVSWDPYVKMWGSASTPAAGDVQ
jgi:beta-mannosidase